MSHQLVKKSSTGGYENVMPKSWIEAIKDKNTGQTLVEVLQGFNMYFLPYNGNTSSTRCLVPTILRKKGLWITYVKYDGNVYTEWYAANEIDDKSWGDNSNWRIGNNTLVGDITISANGNWVINGTETEFKAVGEKGNTPLLRVSNNKLLVSYNLGVDYIDVTDNAVYTKFRVSGNKLQSSTDLGNTWTDVSDYIASQFRWLADSLANNIGRILISRDEGGTWTDLSNNFTNNLHISKYIGANESLPTSGIAEGTIYAKGPTYAVDDTNNDNPIYRLWVYAWKGNTLAWQDNGEFQSIAAGIVQETGYNENAVMSQKVTTEKLTELEREVIYDVSAHNNGAVFESLSALLSSPNLSTLIPTSVRHGGMNIRFIQSSDNNYVQYMFKLSGSFTNEQFVNTSNWEKRVNNSEFEFVFKASGCVELTWLYGLTYYDTTGLPQDFFDKRRISTPADIFYEFPYGGILIIDEDWRGVVYKYETDNKHTFIISTAWISGKTIVELESGYAYKFIISDSLNGIIEASDAIHVQVKSTYDYYLSKNVIESAKIQSDYSFKATGCKELQWQYGLTYFNNTGLPQPGFFDNRRISTPADIFYEFPYGGIVCVDEGWRSVIYKYNIDSEHTFISATDWISGKTIVELENGYVYKFIISNSSNTIIQNNDYVHVQVRDTYDKYLAIIDNPISITEVFSEQINACVSKALSNKDNNTVSIVVMADSHNSSSYNTEQHCLIENELADKISADFLIHLGDIIDGYGSSKQDNKNYLIPMWKNLHQTLRPCLYAIGHHELYGEGRAAQYLNDPTAITISEAIGIWGKDIKWLYNVVFSSDCSSYYFDINGVRFIILNSVATASTVGFTQIEIDLLNSALNNCMLPVVVMAHAPSRQSVNWNNQPVTNGDTVENALSNYGNVIAYIHGHTHWDNEFQPNGVGFPYISTCSSVPWRINIEQLGCDDGNPTSYDRVIGTITEFCIDVYNIHVDTKNIDIFRFGCGSDRTWIHSND